MVGRDIGDINSPGTTSFGHGLADFGHGQLWAFLRVRRGMGRGPKGWGPKTEKVWGPKGRSPKGGDPNP